MYRVGSSAHVFATSQTDPSAVVHMEGRGALPRVQVSMLGQWLRPCHPSSTFSIMFMISWYFFATPLKGKKILFNSYINFQKNTIPHQYSPAVGYSAFIFPSRFIFLRCLWYKWNKYKLTWFSKLCELLIIIVVVIIKIINANFYRTTEGFWSYS